MKGIPCVLILAVLTALGADTQSQNLLWGRPPCKGVADRTFVQDPSSCDGWFQCWNEEGRPGKCREGYYFDRRKAECNYKDKVSCDSKNPCKGKGDGTFVRNPGSCSSYYVCIQEDPKLGQCPDSLVFNPSKQQCVQPEDFKCEENGLQLGNIACQGLADYTFVKNEEVCGEYYVCINEHGKAGKCPQGYLYNGQKGICDFSDAVDCSDVPTPTPPPEKSVCDGIGNGAFIKDPDSCAAYFQCIDGKPKPGKCDEGYWFNPANGMCDHPSNVDCTPNPCEGRPNGEFREHPSNCKAFFQCVDGNSVQGTCPDDYFFNPLNGYCDYKENVDCSGREPTDPTTVKPTDPTTVQPTDPTTVQPTDPTTVQPTDPPTVQPTDPTNQLQEHLESEHQAMGDDKEEDLSQWFKYY